MEDAAVACYAPVNGLYFPWLPFRGGPGTHLWLPDFTHDVVPCAETRGHADCIVAFRPSGQSQPHRLANGPSFSRQDH